MRKFNVNRSDFYPYGKPELKSQTKARLEQIADIGMREVGLAQFGVDGLMSGLYIERVWNYSDKEWDEYIGWVELLIKSKS